MYLSVNTLYFLLLLSADPGHDSFLFPPPLGGSNAPRYPTPALPSILLPVAVATGSANALAVIWQPP